MLFVCVSVLVCGCLCVLAYAARNLARKILSFLVHLPFRGWSFFLRYARDKRRNDKPEQEQPRRDKHRHHKHKKKTNWKPLKLVDRDEVGQLVKDAERCLYTKGVLKKLYEQFPSIDKPVIHQYFYANGFKYDGTVKDLLPLISSTESTDGNHPSHQGEMQCEDLRAEAALHAKLRNEAFQKANAAYSNKQGELAHYYASQGHFHADKMEEANRRAADIALRQRNRERPSNTLDLHMLHVDEALTALREKLQDCSVGSQLYVITGHGKHSKGAAKLKPAVKKYLKGMKMWYTEKNPGMLEVNI